eukprot:TRINITY_DN21899_c0_g1_i1.p1 TRINITY_DN21899_c0_g1~~TRINITY_DN21899_c0_g1_i1.p1  ORF type:complete len:366 (+),score=75.11 TRINITY_DN21899_c0_g1_i1:1-1098(+)
MEVRIKEEACDHCGGRTRIKSEIGYTCGDCHSFLEGQVDVEESSTIYSAPTFPFQNKESWDHLQKQLLDQAHQLIEACEISSETFLVALASVWFRFLVLMQEKKLSDEDHTWIKPNGWPDARFTWSICYLVIRALRIPMSISQFLIHAESITQGQLDGRFPPETEDISKLLDISAPKHDQADQLYGLITEFDFPKEVLRPSHYILEHLDMTLLLPEYDFRVKEDLQKILIAVVAIAIEHNQDIQSKLIQGPLHVNLDPTDAAWKYSKIGRHLDRKTYRPLHESPDVKMKKKKSIQEPMDDSYMSMIAFRICCVTTNQKEDAILHLTERIKRTIVYDLEVTMDREIADHASPKRAKSTHRDRDEQG